MHSDLCIEVSKGIETVEIVESALLLPVTALNLAVMARRVVTDQLVPNAYLCDSPIT